MTDQAIRGTLAGSGASSPAPFRPYVYRGNQPIQTGPGWCECRCGERTQVAKRTQTRYGHVKGRPLRYVTGHNPGAGRAA